MEFAVLFRVNKCNYMFGKEINEMEEFKCLNYIG